MLVDNWQKLSNVELSEDDRAIALWEILHFLIKTPKYDKWRNKLTFRFDIDNDRFEDEVMNCFYKNFYINKIKSNTNQPLPTIEQLLNVNTVVYRRIYTESIIEGKIYKYIFTTVLRHFINTFINNNNLTILDKIELQDYQQNRSSKIEILLTGNIDEISNDPYFRGEENPSEADSLGIDNDEIKNFINHLINFFGFGIANKSIDFLKNHEFCFWLIKRAFDFGDSPNLYEELRNEYNLYASRSNLPQDLARCQTRFQNNVLSTRND
jgi:hypothetical protein